MFTGIIEEKGEVLAWTPTADAAQITIKAPIAVSDAKHGDSISVSGVCLTVIDQGDDWFTADVMAESIAMSTLAGIQVGNLVNLERAAKVGDRIGGHIVQGHIDGTSEILSITDGSAWRVVRLSLHHDLAPLVARKGSIAIDGISLTVSAVGDTWFEVSLIPETLEATTLGARHPGDLVNIETDILARQVQRMLMLGDEDAAPASSVSSPPQRIGFSAVVDGADGLGNAGLRRGYSTREDNAGLRRGYSTREDNAGYRRGYSTREDNAGYRRGYSTRGDTTDPRGSSTTKAGTNS